MGKIQGSWWAGVQRVVVSSRREVKLLSNLQFKYVAITSIMQADPEVHPASYAADSGSFPGLK